MRGATPASGRAALPAHEWKESHVLRSRDMLGWHRRKLLTGGVALLGIWVGGVGCQSMSPSLQPGGRSAARVVAATPRADTAAQVSLPRFDGAGQELGGSPTRQTQVSNKIATIGWDGSAGPRPASAAAARSGEGAGTGGGHS